MTDIGRGIAKARAKGMSDETIKSNMDKLFKGQVGDAVYLFINSIERIKQGRGRSGQRRKIAAERGSAAANTWEHHLGQVKETLAGIKTDLSWIYNIAKEGPKWLAEHPDVTKAGAYGAAGLGVTAAGYLV